MKARLRPGVGINRVQVLRCPICFGTGDACLDHDHDTGLARDVVCMRCNTGLGMFGDDPVIIERAAAYLEKHDAKRWREVVQRFRFTPLSPEVEEATDALFYEKLIREVGFEGPRMTDEMIETARKIAGSKYGYDPQLTPLPPPTDLG